MQDPYKTGKTYFIVCRAYGERIIFGSAAMCVHMVQSMKRFRFESALETHDTSVYPEQPEKQDALKLKVFSYCILPTLYAVLLEQMRPHGISSYIQQLNETVSTYYTALFKTRERVFSSTISWSEIQSDQEKLLAARYIHVLPIRQDMVRDYNMMSYPWSSYDELKHRDTTKVCSLNGIMKHFRNVREFEKFIQTGQV